MDEEKKSCYCSDSKKSSCGICKGIIVIVVLAAIVALLYALTSPA